MLRNVRFPAASPLRRRSVRKAIDEGEIRLGERGRLLIRESGTESVIRVMAEGEDETLVAEVVDEIVDSLERAVS